MKKINNFDKGVEEVLDSITSSGEHVGKTIGTLGRTAKKILIGVGVIVIFGIAAFLWAVGQGIKNKKA